MGSSTERRDGQENVTWSHHPSPCEFYHGAARTKRTENEYFLNNRTYFSDSSITTNNPLMASKRPRPEGDGRSQEHLSYPSLGASEFSATISSAEDPELMIQMLRKFVAVVKSQMRTAIGDHDRDSTNEVEDEDEYSSDDSEKEGSDPLPSKRVKLQAKDQPDWMKDTKSYQVPFVGTSVAKGDCGRNVVAGSWPTGLLEAYLKQSPKAVELDVATNPALDGLLRRLRKREQDRLASRLEKHLLRSLAQAGTACIPILVIRREILNLDDGQSNAPISDSSTVRFASLGSALTERIPSFCEQISAAKIENSAKIHPSGNKKKKQKNSRDAASEATSSIIEPLLHLLRVISLTSSEAAKSTIQGFVKLHAKPQSMERLARRIMTTEAAIEFVDLARGLLVTDPSQIGKLCTKSSFGSIKPSGLICAALYEGFAVLLGLKKTKKAGDEMDELADVLADLLEEIRKKHLNESQVVYMLNSWDLLQNFCQMTSKHAPGLELLGQGAFQAVLDGKDNEDIASRSSDKSVDGEIDGMTRLAIETRRMVFGMLWGSIQINLDLSGRVAFALSQSRHSNQAMRVFLLLCVNRRPELMVELMKNLTLPEETKPLEFVTYLTFITSLLRDGPAPKKISEAGSFHKNVSDATPYLPSKIKSAQWNRALQKGNALVVLKCLQLTNAALDRLQEADVESDMRNFRSWLPNIRSIIGVRTRFPLFTVSKNNSANYMICECMYRAIPKYVRLFSVSALDVDWTKWFPERADVFLKESPLVQCRLLECVSGIAERCDKILIDKLRDSCRVITDAMVETKSTRIQALARNLISQLVPLVLGAPKTDRDVETLLWVDSISNREQAREFFKLLNDATKNRIVNTAHAGVAWQRRCDMDGPKQCVMPALTFPILLTALVRLSSWSDGEDQLVRSMAYRVLFLRLVHEPSPEFLASLVIYFFDKDKDRSGDIFVNLYSYCQYVLERSAPAPAQAIVLLSEKVLPANNNLRHIVASVVYSGDKKQSHDDWRKLSGIQLQSTARLLIHLLTLFGSGSSFGQKCSSLIVPVISSLLFMRLKQLDNPCGSRLRSEAITNRQIEWITTTLNDIFRPDQSTAAMLPINLMLLSTPQQTMLATLRPRIKLFIDSLIGKGDLTTHLVFVGPLAPYYGRISVCTRLIEKYANSSGSLDDEEICKVISKIKRSAGAGETDEFGFDLRTLDRIVRIWHSLYQNATESSLALSTMANYVDFILGEALSSNSIESAYIDGLISKSASEEAVMHGLSPSMGDNESGYYTLRAMIKRNPILHIPHLMTIVDENFSRMKGSIRSGDLDEVLYEALEIISSTIHEYDRAVVGKFVGNLIKCVSSRMASNDPITQVSALSLTLKSVSCDDSGNLFPTINNMLDQAVNDQNVLVDGAEVLRLSSCLAKVICSTKEPSVYKKTAASVFFRGISSLQESVAVLPVYSDASNKCMEKASTLLSCLYDLSEEIEAAETFVGISEMLFSILSNIMSFNFDKTPSTGTAMEVSMRLLERAIERTSQIGDLKSNGESTTCYASTILRNLADHPKIQAILTIENNSSDPLIISIITLLTRCVIVSSKPIQLSPGLWKSIFRCFTAGLGELDVTIRRFLNACFESAVRFRDNDDSYFVRPHLSHVFFPRALKQEVIDAPLLEDIRWNIDKLNNSEEGHAWEWLISNLDTSRIHATVSNFPILDQVSLPTDQSKDAKKIDKLEALIPTNSLGSLNRISRGTDDGRLDKRYSPAFILPLIVAALEDISDEYRTKLYQTDDDRNDRTASRYISRIKRLCEKGITALALSSLSSECATVRMLAFSALHFLLQGLHTSEARKEKSWRERPQLAMVVNAMQRAMVIWNVESGRPEEIPKLSSLVATFIAKSSIIVCKPADDLFLAINRQFLSTENDHGAFRDIDRLPGFMSLFCSSSADAQQSRRERMWALQLLMDGLKDTHCYKLISACHAPELVFTSFDNFYARTPKDPEAAIEIWMHLETLATMLERGGKFAHNHFVQGLGVLSWIRSILVARNMSEVLTKAATTLSIANLIIAAVSPMIRDGAKPQKSPLDLLELQSLVGPLVTLFLNTVPARSSPNDGLIAAICESIHLLATLQFQASEDSALVPEFRSSSGVPVEDTVRFLQHVPEGIMYRTILAFCRLPYRSRSLDSGSEFCQAAISSLSATPVSFTGDRDILSRIEEIINIQGLGIGEQILSLFLANRPYFCRSIERYSHWMSCCRLIVGVYGGNTGASKEYLVARSILEPG